MKRRIAITGIAGFLGSHIAEALLPEYDVVGFDNLSGGELNNVPDGASFDYQDCQCILPEDLNGVDTVFHCAALAHEGLSVFSPKIITESIFGASVAVFSAAIAAGVRRIVYCSSMSRYGIGSPPFTEEQDTAPVDPYAIAKVATEAVLKLLCDVHGVEYIVAVPHNIIGPRQKYDDPFRNVAAIMANRMLQGLPPIVYGDGNQTRCFSDVRDVLPLFVKMIDGPWGMTVNVGPDEEEVSINQLVGHLKNLIPEAPEEVIYVRDRPQEVKRAVCSSDRARRIYGYSTNYLLVETLRSLVFFIRERGTRPFNYHLPIEIETDQTPTTWAKELI